MKLPYSDRLEISQPKVVQYLLSSTHRAGRGKARFFSAFGFQVSSWETLAKALRICDRLSLKTEGTMIQELEDVILESDLPQNRLQRGDIGTVVLVHQGAKVTRSNLQPWMARRLPLSRCRLLRYVPPTNARSPMREIWLVPRLSR